MRKISNRIVVLSVLAFGLLVRSGYASESVSKSWDRSYQASEVIDRGLRITKEDISEESKTWYLTLTVRSSSRSLDTRDLIGD